MGKNTNSEENIFERLQKLEFDNSNAKRAILAELGGIQHVGQILDHFIGKLSDSLLEIAKKP